MRTASKSASWDGKGRPLVGGGPPPTMSKGQFNTVPGGQSQDQQPARDYVNRWCDVITGKAQASQGSAPPPPSASQLPPPPPASKPPTPLASSNPPAAAPRSGPRLATPKPQGQTQPNVIKDCKKWLQSQGDELCKKTAAAGGISVADFHRLNPDVGPQCTNFWKNTSYCVGD